MFDEKNAFICPLCKGLRGATIIRYRTTADRLEQSPALCRCRCKQESKSDAERPSPQDKEHAG